ncbi:MAG TPA: MinD/ParA family protein [Candidatus Bathyarchaeia archaeon]|nr:MinD/ParA family protein [Candidatus Bathyarchaeia archaeon]
MGKILAIHSYKGGTGKTLLSVNLSTLYANRGKSVALLDLDFRAPSLQAILKVQNSEYWINDYLNGVCDVKKALVDLSQSHAKRGRLLVGLANPSTQAIREMTAKDRKWEMKALGRLLSLKTSLLSEMGLDYVIFDTSPGLQYSSINAIVSADVVLVVSGTDISDIKGTQRMIDELYDLFEKKTGLVMNKVLFDVLESKNQRAELAKKLLSSNNLPMIEMIPCFCDILRAGGVTVFVNEKPEHPFVKTLDRMATTIETL